MPYDVIIGRSAERELKALPAEIARRIGARLQFLATDPRPTQATRLRNGAKTVTVLAVGHRREIYRDQ